MLEEAIEYFTKSIELNPKFTNAYYNRGRAYIEQYINTKPKGGFPYVIKLENIEPIINDFTKAIELNPEFTNAYFNRGVVYQFQKKYEEAIKDFEKVLSLCKKENELYELSEKRIKECKEKLKNKNHNF